MAQVTIKQQQRGPALKLIFSAICPNDNSPGLRTETIDVDDLAMIRFYLCFIGGSTSCYMSVKKKETMMDYKAKMSIFCNGEEKRMNCLNDWSKDVLLARLSPNFDIESTKCAKCSTKSKIYLFTFEVNITIEDVTRALPTNERYYEDNELTDLLLCAPEGTVAVHKFIIIQHSDIIRQRLREIRDGLFPIPDVTVQTLQNLKNFLYMGTLPADICLPQLLLFAIQYQMNQLKADCIMKLATVVKAAELDTLIDFAIQHNLPELIRAILSVTSEDTFHGSHRIRRSRITSCALNLAQLALE